LETVLKQQEFSQLQAKFKDLLQTIKVSLNQD